MAQCFALGAVWSLYIYVLFLTFFRVLLLLFWIEGKGIKRDEKKAVFLMEGAAKAGDTQALFTLGRSYVCILMSKRLIFLIFATAAGGWYFRGNVGLQKDDKRAFELYLAASKKRHPGLYSNLCALLLVLIAFSFEGATFNVATFYMLGDGMAERDILKAVEYYTIAADMGMYQAAVNLGTIKNRMISTKCWEFYCCAGSMHYEGLPPLKGDIYKARDIFAKYAHLGKPVQDMLAALNHRIAENEKEKQNEKETK